MRWLSTVTGLVCLTGCAASCARSHDPDAGDVRVQMGAARDDATRKDRKGIDAGPNDGVAARFVPATLRVRALPGGNGVLELVALTLRSGAAGAELYAALKNVGDIPACSAALSVELFDSDERSLAAAISGLLTQHFYRRTDGSGSIAACVGPGDTTMAAITDFSPELHADDVRTVVYRCPYFALEVMPIEGLSIGELSRVDSHETAVFTGTLHNGLDVTLSAPSVHVFVVSLAGRPLAMASAESGVQVKIPPGGLWTFETLGVRVRGPDALAFAAGALGK